MNNEIQMIAADLDGTLLTDESELSTKNFCAIKAISAAGCEFAIVTGRTYFEIPEELRALKEIKYVIYSDGAVIYDKTSDNILHTEYIPRETARIVFDILKKNNGLIELYEDKTVKTDEINLAENLFVGYGVDPYYIPVIFKTRKGVKDLDFSLSQYDKIELFNCFFKTETDRQNCWQELSSVQGIEFTTSMENNIEIMSSKATKGNALRELCSITGIDINNVVAIGDSANDIPMLSEVGHPLVPANAKDEIKKYANEVICSNNDGIADYVKDKYF